MLERGKSAIAERKRQSDMIDQERGLTFSKIASMGYVTARQAGDILTHPDDQIVSSAQRKRPRTTRRQRLMRDENDQVISQDSDTDAPNSQSIGTSHSVPIQQFRGGDGWFSGTPVQGTGSRNSATAQLPSYSMILQKKGNQDGTKIWTK